MDQLTQILKVTGVPGPEFVQKLDSPEVEHIQFVHSGFSLNKTVVFSNDVLLLLNPHQF